MRHSIALNLAKAFIYGSKLVINIEVLRSSDNTILTTDDSVCFVPKFRFREAYL